MTRTEYLKELEENLIALPKEERDMAVSFYEEYFDEAGPENEQATIDELGKPYNLARSIIGETSAYSKSQVYLKYKESKPMPQNSTDVFDSIKNALKKDDAPADTTDDVIPNGYKGGTAQNDVPKTGAGMFDQYYAHAGNDEDKTEDVPPQYSQEYSQEEEQTVKKPMDAGIAAILIIIGIIFGIPLLCGIIPAVLAIIAAMAAIGVAAAVCFLAAVIIFIVGVVLFFKSIPTALACIFSAFLAAGAGYLLLAATIMFFGKFLPWSVRSIRKLFSKRSVKQW